MNHHRIVRVLPLVLTILFLALLAYGAHRLSKARTFQLCGGLVARVETAE